LALKFGIRIRFLLGEIGQVDGLTCKVSGVESADERIAPVLVDNARQAGGICFWRCCLAQRGSRQAGE